MSQMLAADGSLSSKLVACDSAGNLYMVSALPATLEATIALNESLSGVVDFGSRSLSAILMPAAWTAAALTFEASVNGEDFFDLLDSEGAEVEVAVAADDFVRLTNADWAAIRWLRIRSGTAAVPVAQEAARTLQLVAVA
jgi:hypothetical protein